MLQYEVMTEYMTTLRTYREIQIFLNTAHAWLEAHPAESKFRYALKKVVKSCMTIWEGYVEQVNDLNIEHCATNKDGVIVKDERDQYTFTKDGLRKRNAVQKALFCSSVAIEPYMAKDVPQDLSDAEREAFAGFVLPDAELSLMETGA